MFPKHILFLHVDPGLRKCNTNALSNYLKGHWCYIFPYFENDLEKYSILTLKEMPTWKLFRLNTICVNGIKSKERVHFGLSNPLFIFGLRQYWSSWQNYGYCLLGTQGTPSVVCTYKTPRGYCAGIQA